MSGRKQTSVYKDNDVSEFHFENHGVHFTVLREIAFMNDVECCQTLERI